MKHLIAGTAFLLLTLATSAQIKFTSLSELLDYADTHGTVARSSRLHEEMKNKDVSLYRATLLPRVGYVGTADYYPVLPSQVIPEKILGGTTDKFTIVQFGLPFTFSTGLELSMPLFDPEKREEWKRLLLEKEKVKYQTRTQLEALQIQIAQAYYNALLGREMMTFSEASRTAAGQLLSILEERKKQGLLNPADYNRAKALKADIESNSITYELFSSKAHTALHQLLAIPFSDSIALTEKAGLDWTPGIVLANRERPSLLAARAEVDIAGQALRLSKKAAFPKLHLAARYTYQWQLQKSQIVHFDMSTVGLKLGVPLFAGNYYNIAQKKSKLVLEMAKLKEQQTVYDIEKEQADWRNHYTAAANKNKILQKKIAATSDNLRIANLAVKEGVMEFEEFNTIFQEWSKAHVEYLQNLNEGLLYQFLLTQKL